MMDLQTQTEKYCIFFKPSSKYNLLESSWSRQLMFALRECVYDIN